MTDDDEMILDGIEASARRVTKMFEALAPMFADAVADPNDENNGVRPFILGLASLMGSYIGNLSTGMVEPQQGQELILSEVRETIENVARQLLRTHIDPNSPLDPRIVARYSLTTPLKKRGKGQTRH